MPKPVLNISLKVDSDHLISQIYENIGDYDLCKFILDLTLEEQDASFTVDVIKDLIKSIKEDSPEDIEEIKKELFG